MAYQDQDSADQYEPVQPPTPGTPAPGSQGSLASRYPSIVDAYKTYLGRSPSDAEILSQTGNGTFAPSDPRLSRSVQNIAQSPEAKQYADTRATQQPGSTPTTPPRTAKNNPGLDEKKWLAGHVSPKYTFREVAQKYDQKTEQGRQQTLTELQQKYPKWFTGWAISGDKIRFSGDPKTLDKEWDGYNEFDAWVGSKEGTWRPSWQPTQRYGQAYTATAVPVAAPVTPGTTTPGATTPGAAPVTGTPASAQAASDWFAANRPAGPEPYTNPAMPSGLQDPYAAPARPDNLASPYTPPTFTAPTYDELAGDPGYQSRLNTGVQARDRMASAKGTILSGGYGKAITRYAQEFANDEYQNLYGRRMGEFQTQAGLGLGARQVNESAYQDDVVNAQNTYGIRNNAYQQAVGNAS
ncbi:MAG: hypothetical protein M3Q55_08890, partial [Acidobacteriota bacterium]|nr:hypothetical protein [Acidobacteriota bacterium]